MRNNRFNRIQLSSAEVPPSVVLPDYPSALGDRERAASLLGRLESLGKIHRYAKESYPPDLEVCQSHLIVKDDKVRVARDWSNALYPLNSVLANPSVQYGTMDEFLGLLSPGAYMGGADFKDCSLHSPVSPSCRR